MEVIVHPNLGSPNKNNRTYTDKNFEPFLGKSFYGQLGFPDRRDGIQKAVTTDLSKVSHQIENLRIVDGNVVGTLKVLDTPNGNILKELMTHKDGSGFALRGIIQQPSRNEIELIDIISFDYVSNPA